jgi:hypothetical protein
MISTDSLSRRRKKMMRSLSSMRERSLPLRKRTMMRRKRRRVARSPRRRGNDCFGIVELHLQRVWAIKGVRSTEGRGGE